MTDNLLSGAKSIISDAPTAIALLDLKLCYLSVSPKWRLDFGLGNAEIAGKALYDLSPEISHAWRPLLQECLKTNKTIDNQAHTLIRQDGTAKLLSWCIKPWLAPNDTISGFIIYSEDLTDRKETEAKLQESEIHFRRAFENSAIGMSIIDLEGQWVDVNDTLCKILGYSKDELLGRNFKPITHADDLAIQMELKKEILSGLRNSYQMEKRVYHKQGHTFWVSISSSIIRDAQGNPKHFISQVEDISARKQADRELQEEKKLLRTLIDNLPLNVYIKDLQSKKTLANRAEYEFMGAQSEADILGKDDFELYPYDIAQSFIESDREVFASGIPLLNQESLIKRKDGSEKWYLLSKIPLKGDTGDIKGLLGISYDITERKKFEKELLDTQNLLNQAEAISNTGSIEINFKTGKRKWSNEFYRILGLEPNSMEASAEAFVSFLHPDDKEKYLRWFYDSVGKRVNSADIETRIIRADGEVRTIFVYGIGIISEQDIPEKIFGVIQDITLKKQAEEKTAHAQNLLERAESIAHIGSAEVDFKTKKAIWSKELYKILGEEPATDDLKFGVINKYLHPDERTKYWQWVEHGLQNKSQVDQLESRIIRTDGTERDVMIYGYVEYDVLGIPDKIFGVFKDITDDKKILRELQTSKQVYQSLFYKNPSAVFSVALNGHFTSANQAFIDNTEFNIEDLLLKNFADITNPSEANKVLAFFADAKNGFTRQFESKVITGTGKTLVVSVIFIPIVVDNLITGVYGIANDISEVKRQEAIDKLEREIWDYYNNKHNSIEAIILLLLQGLEKIHPNMLCSVLKYSEGKLYNWASASVPKGYIDAIDGFTVGMGVGSCGTAAYLREKIIVKDIGTDPLWKGFKDLAYQFNLKACWSSPLIDSNKNLLGTFAIYHNTVREVPPDEEQSIERARIILTNIIENKKAEEELNIKEKAIASSMSGIGMTDLGGRVVYANDALAKMWGCTNKDELIGKTLEEVFDGDGSAKTVAALHKYGNKKGEAIGRKIDGTLFNVAFSSNMIYDEKGLPVRIFGSYIDITENKLNEKALKQSHELLEKLTDQVPAAIYQFRMAADATMSFEFMSSGITKVIPGVTPAQMKENVRLGFSMIHPDDIDLFRQTLFASRENLTEWSIQYRIVTKQQNIIWHKVTAQPEKQDDGSVVWYGYFQDVTAQKSQEQEREHLILELSQHNKDLRHFSYITSHNLRAPLSNLVGLVNLIDDMQVADSMLAELLKGFKTSTLLLNDTVNDLLKVLTVKDNLSIKQEDIELSTVFDKISSQIKLLIDNVKPEIVFDCSACPMVTFNKVYMESIFLNLITNAIKYRSPKRPLKITITSHPDGDNTMLIFADNGLGIDADRYKDRIFGLYQRFHNHPDSKGFGLYMVKSQMEALGGKAEIKSAVDIGTELILTFKNKSNT